MRIAAIALGLGMASGCVVVDDQPHHGHVPPGHVKHTSGGHHDRSVHGDDNPGRGHGHGHEKHHH